MPFFFIFKHLWAPNRSWKIIHGVLESTGKVLNFLSVKEWEPCHRCLQVQYLYSYFNSQYVFLQHRAMGSHSVTCHPTQVNAPRLNPSQAVTQFTYPRGMEGWVDLGYPAMHRPETEPKSRSLDHQSDTLTTTPPWYLKCICFKIYVNTVVKWHSAVVIRK